MENINTFAEGLLKDLQSRAALCEQYENDVDFLEKNFEGKIESSLLLRLIDVSYKDKRIQNILDSVLYFCDGNSITCEIFEKLIHYPRRMRRNYLISLGHCELAFYQLWYIVQQRVGTEAYCQLLHRVYSNPCFSDKDLTRFLRNGQCSELVVIAAVQALLRERTDDSAKRTVAEKFLKEGLEGAR